MISHVSCKFCMLHEASCINTDFLRSTPWPRPYLESCSRRPSSEFRLELKFGVLPGRGRTVSARERTRRARDGAATHREHTICTLRRARKKSAWSDATSLQRSLLEIWVNQTRNARHLLNAAYKCCWLHTYHSRGLPVDVREVKTDRTRERTRRALGGAAPHLQRSQYTFHRMSKTSAGSDATSLQTILPERWGN